MITFQNIIRHDALPWDDYVNLPGYSHSFLKREVSGFLPEFNETEMVKLGKLVDMILTDPGQADMSAELYQAAKQIAVKILTEYGDLVRFFQKQISFTATASTEGLSIPVKGRLDYLINTVAVLDLKITKSRVRDLPRLIAFMGYQNQLFGYAKMAQVNEAYLLFYSITDKRAALLPADVHGDENEFWEDKAIKFGRVAA